MPAKKSKTPMTGAQRFAKYAAKMTEANQEQWSSKMTEKRANYVARMSEQQKDAMRTRDKEREKACSLMVLPSTSNKASSSTLSFTSQNFLELST